MNPQNSPGLMHLSSFRGALHAFALRPLLGGVARMILPGVEAKYTDAAISSVENYLVSRFTDPSRELGAALGRASDRSWRAVEVALTGESLWSRFTDRGEDKAFRADIRTFLDSNPLQLPDGRAATFCRAALRQLRAAREAGLIPGDGLSPSAAAEQATGFLRFASPSAVCDAEWQLMGEIACGLREHRLEALAELIELRPVANQPPLLAVAVRFFFRREVETNRQLFQGLVYDRVDQVRQVLEDGLGRLSDALQYHGESLLQVLGVAEEIHTDVLDLKAEQAKLGDGFREIYLAVFKLGEKLDRLHERSLRQIDVTSIKGNAERQLVKAVKAKFRALSVQEHREVPALLNAIGKLELAAGDYDEAQHDFRLVASMVSDEAGKAAAHHGAFLAALERRDWGTALSQFLEATRLDPVRFALFPLDRYEPERILGAGGFGIVFQCRNRLSGARLVVKSLRIDDLDRDASDILQEAGVLEQLDHEAIIRLRDCGWADANQSRPYLVMDNFDGVSLEEFIKGNGPLPTVEEAKALARQMAKGLEAAHGQGILHRDVKPGNVLVRREPSGLRIKLIDFGLAIQQRTIRDSMTSANALPNTLLGQSIAGTVDYASPEQMGQLTEGSLGPRSDVYGFGRTLCFALFGNPKPGPRHWRELRDEQFGELIGECIEEHPDNRPDGFTPILNRLAPTPIIDDSGSVDPRIIDDLSNRHSVTLISEGTERDGEQEAWLDAYRTATLESFLQYLRCYPKGAHAAVACKEADDRAWARVQQQQTVEVYRWYLGLCTQIDGAHEGEAGSWLATWEQSELERMDWERSQEAGTPDAYSWHANRWPNGSHSAEAQRRAANMLRVELLADLKNPQLRGRYLAVRTPDLAERDVADSRVSARNAILWACSGLIIGVILAVVHRYMTNRFQLFDRYRPWHLTPWAVVPFVAFLLVFCSSSLLHLLTRPRRLKDASAPAAGSAMGQALGGGCGYAIVVVVYCAFSLPIVHLFVFEVFGWYVPFWTHYIISAGYAAGFALSLWLLNRSMLEEVARSKGPLPEDERPRTVSRLWVWIFGVSAAGVLVAGSYGFVRWLPEQFSAAKMLFPVKGVTADEVIAGKHVVVRSIDEMPDSWKGIAMDRTFYRFYKSMNGDYYYEIYGWGDQRGAWESQFDHWGWSYVTAPPREKYSKRVLSNGNWFDAKVKQSQFIARSGSIGIIVTFEAAIDFLDKLGATEVELLPASDLPH
jgi:serine/threonine protein kinase